MYQKDEKQGGAEKQSNFDETIRRKSAANLRKDASTSDETGKKRTKATKMNQYKQVTEKTCMGFLEMEKLPSRRHLLLSRRHWSNLSCLPKVQTQWRCKNVFKFWRKLTKKQKMQGVNCCPWNIRSLRENFMCTKSLNFNFFILTLTWVIEEDIDESNLDGTISTVFRFIRLIWTKKEDVNSD